MIYDHHAQSRTEGLMRGSHRLPQSSSAWIRDLAFGYGAPIQAIELATDMPHAHMMEALANSRYLTPRQVHRLASATWLAVRPLDLWSSYARACAMEISHTVPERTDR